MAEKWICACPFCGSEPTIQYWHGGGPDKKSISCENEACFVSPSVTGETRDQAVRRWNYRCPSGGPSFKVKRSRRSHDIGSRHG